MVDVQYVDQTFRGTPSSSSFWLSMTMRESLETPVTHDAGDTRRSDIDGNVDCESDLKKNSLLPLFVKSEKQVCSQKVLPRSS